MSKTVYIAEKPSVAIEFAKALKLKTTKRDGFIESDEAIITWCVGHLVTMSYPEAYDPALKKWNLEPLPFLPADFKYEILPAVKKQFNTVKNILNRSDVSTIYVCTDSGREGEYIYRLVEQEAKVKGKERKRVWIDSQTEDEILRGIKEAKDLSAYDNLSASAYLRAIEDYLMGINFSRVLTLRYGDSIARETGQRYAVVSVGRVMTCVLGIVVKREREIREFVETPFYRVMGTFLKKHDPHSKVMNEAHRTSSMSSTSDDICTFEGEWKAIEGSRYFESPKLYKENGFRKREDAEELILFLSSDNEINTNQAKVTKVEKKKETKYAPLLYNLAELQNDCSKRFKINPDETLRVVQELYEKKMLTYPRTDARVLSTAVAKEISKNLNGLMQYEAMKPFLQDIVSLGTHKKLEKTRYVNDSLITDHYAIIPTGQGLGGLEKLAPLSQQVFELITKRFLSIFYPPAEYQKISIIAEIQNEHFFTNLRVLKEPGYLKVVGIPDNERADLFEQLSTIRKGSTLNVEGFQIKEGKTSPPKRYSSGSIILTMENAGQFIENDELREQIKGSGIGTSATRAEILKKLVSIKYINLNKKTQIITPTFLGEMVYDVVDQSIKALLNPELTASWEKGLTLVANGEISLEDYRVKLDAFVRSRTEQVKGLNNTSKLQQMYRWVRSFYTQKEIDYIAGNYPTKSRKSSTSPKKKPN